MTHYEASDGIVRIRPVRAADLNDLYAAIHESLAELAVWMVWAHPDYRIEETKEFMVRSEASWNDGTAFNFAVLDFATGTFCGTVGLNRIDRDYEMCNLGYWIRTSETGRGLASRATRMVARFGLRELGLQRIEIVAAAENLASQRTAEKAGAHREGLLRHRLRTKGDPLDAVMYSLITGDFPD
jgi:RimJ/RimL family protein N-acetyltransferase